MGKRCCPQLYHLSLWLDNPLDKTGSLDPILMTTVAVTCIKITDGGTVADAFIVISAGNSERDHAIIAWVKKLRWGVSKPGDTSRNKWMPMQVAFGKFNEPEMPSDCKPKTSDLQGI